MPGRTTMRHYDIPAAAAEAAEENFRTTAAGGGRALTIPRYLNWVMGEHPHLDGLAWSGLV